MNNNCELCGGKYDFRMVQINECLNMIGIALSGSKRQVNNDNRFRFCPKCGRELTKENFVGVDKRDKHAYLFSYNNLNKLIFSDRQECLDIVLDAEKNAPKISNEKEYEEY